MDCERCTKGYRGGAISRRSYTGTGPMSGRRAGNTPRPSSARRARTPGSANSRRPLSRSAVEAAGTRPPWNDNIHDLSQYASSPDELRERHDRSQSKNLARAAEELHEKQERLRKSFVASPTDESKMSALKTVEDKQRKIELLEEQRRHEAAVQQQQQEAAAAPVVTHSQLAFYPSISQSSRGSHTSPSRSRVSNGSDMYAGLDFSRIAADWGKSSDATGSGGPKLAAPDDGELVGHDADVFSQDLSGSSRTPSADDLSKGIGSAHSTPTRKQRDLETMPLDKSLRDALRSPIRSRLLPKQRHSPNRSKANHSTPDSHRRSKAERRAMAGLHADIDAIEMQLKDMHVHPAAPHDASGVVAGGSQLAASDSGHYSYSGVTNRLLALTGRLIDHLNASRGMIEEERATRVELQQILEGCVENQAIMDAELQARKEENAQLRERVAVMEQQMERFRSEAAERVEALAQSTEFRAASARWLGLSRT